MIVSIDTNVISALWSDEPDATSIRLQLRRIKNQGQLIICPVVYIELAAYPRTDIKYVDQFLRNTDIDVDFDMTPDIWRDAAGRFAAYAKRRRSSGGGHGKRLPADFIIGSHALHAADRLFTLENSRYQTDFPELSMV